MEQPRYFPGVNALRGLAATLVVIQHAGYWSSITTQTPLDRMIKVPFGLIGVLMFFTISGFVIGLNRHSPAGEFIVRRALRIYPGYWAALALSIVLMVSIGFSTEIQWFMLLLLPSTTYPPMYVPVWTLIFEVAFYIAAAAVFRLRLSDEKLSGVILGWMLVIVTMSPYITGDRMAMPGLLILVAQYCLFFAGGMLCAIYLDTLRRIPTNALLAVAVAGSAISPSLGQLPALSLLGVVMAALLLVATRVQIRSRLAQMMGNASYGLFLLHYSVQGVAGMRLQGHLTDWGMAAALLAIALAVGVPFGLAEFAVHRRILRAFQAYRQRPPADAVAAPRA